MQRTFRRHQIITLIAVLMLPLFLFVTMTGNNPGSTANKDSKTLERISYLQTAADR